MSKRAKPSEEALWFTRYFETDDYEEFNLEVLGPEVSSEQVSRVIHWLGLRPPQRVLDLCSGAGRHSAELARRGFRVVGVELSPYQLGKSRHRSELLASTPPLVRGDARQIPLRTESVEAVLCLFNSFGYFSDEGNRATMAEIARVLQPGGQLLLDVLNRDAFLLHQPERVWDRVPSGLVLQDLEYQAWTGRLRTEWTYVRNDGSVRTLTTLNRLYSAHELIALCRDSGLDVLDLSDAEVKGYFNWRHSHALAIVARKREA